MAERGERSGTAEASHASIHFIGSIYKWDQYDTDWDDWGTTGKSTISRKHPRQRNLSMKVRSSTSVPDPSMFEADLELNSDDETEIDEPVVVSTDPKKAPQMNGGDWLVTLKVGPIPKYRLAEIEEEKRGSRQCRGVPLLQKNRTSTEKKQLKPSST